MTTPLHDGPLDGGQLDVSALTDDEDALGVLSAQLMPGGIRPPHRG